MCPTTDDDWSPADNPYAIAVSESQWWCRATQLAVARLSDHDDQRSSPISSRQIDARNLVLALTQILTAENLEQIALRELGIDPTVGLALAQARQRFEDDLPGIQQMRNALSHFDNWALGYGHGVQRKLVRDGNARRDVARSYWGFRYDVAQRVVALGPYSIAVDAAGESAHQLAWAIYVAAGAVDQQSPETAP